VTLHRIAALLGLGRVAIGISVWAAPRRAVGALGFDSDSAQVIALARLAGTRDVALGGAAAACAHDALAAATITRLNAGVDALDALAFGVALIRRRGIDRAGLIGTASAAAGAVTGLLVAARLDRTAARQPRI
jgi:hypothetical protein